MAKTLHSMFVVGAYHRTRLSAFAKENTSKIFQLQLLTSRLLVSLRTLDARSTLNPWSGDIRCVTPDTEARTTSEMSDGGSAFVAPTTRCNATMVNDRDHPSPHGNLVLKRLQQANSARSASRESKILQSPYREGAEFLFASHDLDSQYTSHHLDSAAFTQEPVQNEMNEDTLARLQARSNGNGSAASVTLSPSDAFLTNDEEGEDFIMPLFPQASHSMLPSVQSMLDARSFEYGRNLQSSSTEQPSCAGKSRTLEELSCLVHRCEGFDCTCRSCLEAFSTFMGEGGKLISWTKNIANLK